MRINFSPPAIRVLPLSQFRTSGSTDAGQWLGNALDAAMDAVTSGPNTGQATREAIVDIHGLDGESWNLESPVSKAYAHASNITEAHGIHLRGSYRDCPLAVRFAAATQPAVHIDLGPMEWVNFSAKGVHFRSDWLTGAQQCSIAMHVNIGPLPAPAVIRECEIHATACRDAGFKISGTGSLVARDLAFFGARVNATDINAPYLLVEGMRAIDVARARSFLETKYDNISYANGGAVSMVRIKAVDDSEGGTCSVKLSGLNVSSDCEMAVQIYSGTAAGPERVVIDGDYSKSAKLVTAFNVGNLTVRGFTCSVTPAIHALHCFGVAHSYLEHCRAVGGGSLKVVTDGGHVEIVETPLTTLTSPGPTFVTTDGTRVEV